MSRRNLILVVTLIAFGFGVYFYFVRTETSLRKGLSSRSKEFVKSQQAAGSSDWKNVDLENSRRAAGVGGPQIIDVDGCFSFDLPFPIIFQRKSGECSYWFSVELPKSQITTYMNKVEYTSLEQDSGVFMRRNDKSTYTEETKTLNKRQWAIFQKEGGAYEVSAFNLQDGRLIIVNIVSTSNENLDKQLQRMLESIKVAK